MAKTPRATDSGLPRREPNQALDEAQGEGVKHQHGETEHLHRLGLVHHDHDEDGRPVFHAEPRFVPAVTDDTVDLAGAAVPGDGEQDGPSSSLALVNDDEADGPDRLTELIRPDAGEAMLSGFMGIINPADEPGFALTLAEEGMRLGRMAQTLGEMARDHADKRLVEDKHIRALHLKVLQMAATHGLDLSEVGS